MQIFKICDRLTESFEYNFRISIIDHTVIIFLYFWGVSILISIVTGPVYTPTWEYKYSSSFTSLPNLLSIGFYCLCLVLPFFLVFFNPDLTRRLVFLYLLFGDFYRFYILTHIHSWQSFLPSYMISLLIISFIEKKTFIFKFHFFNIVMMLLTIYHASMVFFLMPMPILYLCLCLKSIWPCLI